MKQFLEEEQKSRKELERVVRKLAKQKNDCAWDDGGHWTHPYNHPHPSVAVCAHGYIYVSSVVEGQVCVCVCVYLCIHLCCISIFQSCRVGPPSVTTMLGVSLLQMLEHDLTFWWNLTCLPDPASLVVTTNLPLHEAAQLSYDWSSGMFVKTILSLGDWHCEHSPANGTILDKDETSSLLLLLLHLEIENGVQSH